MKYILTVFFSFLFLIAFAQDSTEVNFETPKIVSKLPYGKTIKIEDLEFKFIAVESDSRCPKGVQCIWAGEAIALIDVIKNGKKIEQKRVVFSTRLAIINKLGNVFSSEKLKISAFSIAPYPVYESVINKEDYFIMLDVRD